MQCSFLYCVQLQNQSELRAYSAERAAFLLDTALAARSTNTSACREEDRRNSHMLFTLHVSQYRMEKSSKAGSTIACVVFLCHASEQFTSTARMSLFLLYTFHTRSICRIISRQLQRLPNICFFHYHALHVPSPCSPADNKKG